MVKVLFDHNMPARIARALNELVRDRGHEVFALKERFPVDISDVDIFTELGKDSDWIVISKDVRQARRAPEKAAILKYGVVAFYLAPAVGRQSILEQAATIIWQWEKMVAQRMNNRNGLFLLPVNKGSKFSAI